jgi:hypothetical protein
MVANLGIRIWNRLFGSIGGAPAGKGCLKNRLSDWNALVRKHDLLRWADAGDDLTMAATCHVERTNLTVRTFTNSPSDSHAQQSVIQRSLKTQNT